MKQLAVLTLLVFCGIAAWLFASRLSADALGMAVGLLFGVLAGVPTALLVLAANRRRAPVDDDDDEQDPRARYAPQGFQHALPYQPPVVVVTGGQAAPQQWQGQPQQQWPGQQWGGQQWPGQQWPGPQTVDSVGYPVRQALPGPGAAGNGRVFKVVGEKEEWLDEF